MNQTRVNFKSSSLFWDGDSCGIFNLSSLLKCYESPNKFELIGLSESVLAGNMYKNSNLIKLPAYLFQVAGSDAKQTIFRSPVSGSFFKKKISTNQKISDTSKTSLFKSFKINIVKEDAFEIRSFSDIKNFFYYNNFSAKVNIVENKSLYKLEFPIKHFNMSLKNKKWQVETGPILFPIFNDKLNHYKYIPSFIFFNSLDKIEIFYDFPFGERNEFSTLPIKNKFNCDVKILASGN